MSVVEAMACGTPVIAHQRGSMGEIIQHGVNGFLVTDLAGSLEAIDDLVLIDRALVRESVAARFDVSRMVDDYLALYARVLDAGGGPLRQG